MDDNETVKHDDKFRDLLLVTKIKAEKNLKYRIIQQIETENELLMEKIRNRSALPLINFSLSVIGVMIALIAFITAGFYFEGGKDRLVSPSFFMLVLLVFIVCIFFLLISVLDESRRNKPFSSTTAVL